MLKTEGFDADLPKVTEKSTPPSALHIDINSEVLPMSFINSNLLSSVDNDEIMWARQRYRECRQKSSLNPIIQQLTYWMQATFDI